MEIKRNVLKVNIYGDSYELRFPTVKEIRNFSSNDSKNEDDVYNTTFEFLSKLGLPTEVIEEMEVGHLQQIIEVLSSQKKS